MSSLLAALIFVYLFMPALWKALTSADDCDVHHASLAVVAARNPVRETGPPANMAKLILLRHKVNLLPPLIAIHHSLILPTSRFKLLTENDGTPH
ncbi:hypothetical protein L218DRAFT_994963 [Marasmius fiardii PR-910]|nr:hypothetical protein L218DRAFT_994963 [Marasmius fiardii PR-910]